MTTPVPAQPDSAPHTLIWPGLALPIALAAAAFCAPGFDLVAGPAPTSPLWPTVLIGAALAALALFIAFARFSPPPSTPLPPVLAFSLALCSPLFPALRLTGLAILDRANHEPPLTRSLLLSGALELATPRGIVFAAIIAAAILPWLVWWFRSPRAAPTIGPRLRDLPSALTLLSLLILISLALSLGALESLLTGTIAGLISWGIVRALRRFPDHSPHPHPRAILLVRIVAAIFIFALLTTGALRTLAARAAITTERRAEHRAIEHLAALIPTPPPSAPFRLIRSPYTGPATPETDLWNLANSGRESLARSALSRADITYRLAATPLTDSLAEPNIIPITFTDRAQLRLVRAATLPPSGFGEPPTTLRFPAAIALIQSAQQTARTIPALRLDLDPLPR